MRDNARYINGLFVICLLVGGWLAGCGGREAYVPPAQGGQPAQSGQWTVGQTQQGMASWYGPKFHGKPTASGEPFDMHGISAAHRTLPLGTLVEVTNLDNGKTIRLVINDRGPYAHGRILDLSYGAAKELGYVEQGTARVKLVVVQLGTGKGAAPEGDGQLESAAPPAQSGMILVERTDSWWKADRLRQFLKGSYQTVRIEQQGDEYLVLIGPFASPAVRDRILQRLRLEGYDAEIR